MKDEGNRARRFLNAFADIEQCLARQQNKRNPGERYTPFRELVRDSRNLVPKHKEKLNKFAELRNAISHEPYVDDVAIADPREDTVKTIENLRTILLAPPRLKDALKPQKNPRIFSLDDPITDFLHLVVQNDFSQSPVDIENGKYGLITTNAVTRWFSHHLKENGGLLEGETIREVMSYSEVGEQLQTVSVNITTAEAINIFSGVSSSHKEPPAALLVMGLPGRPPEKLSVRFDLPALYAQLGE